MSRDRAASRRLRVVAPPGLPVALALVAGSAAMAVGQGVPAAAPVDDDAPPILVSRQLLDAERLGVGDVVRLAADPSGQGARRFRVVGVYEPTPARCASPPNGSRRGCISGICSR